MISTPRSSTTDATSSCSASASTPTRRSPRGPASSRRRCCSPATRPDGRQAVRLDARHARQPQPVRHRPQRDASRSGCCRSTSWPQPAYDELAAAVKQTLARARRHRTDRDSDAERRHAARRRPRGRAAARRRCTTPPSPARLPAPLTTRRRCAIFRRAPDQRIWLYRLRQGGAPRWRAAAVAHAAAVAPHDRRRRGRRAGRRSPSPFTHGRLTAGDHPLPGAQLVRRRARASARRRPACAATTSRIVLDQRRRDEPDRARRCADMAESDLVQLFELLLGSGLDIGAMNAVRKRFTRWGAGRLALALAPARTHVLLMSDVPGDDPADIGSGPCAPDAWTARDVVSRSCNEPDCYDRASRPSLRDYLDRACARHRRRRRRSPRIPRSRT